MEGKGRRGDTGFKGGKEQAKKVWAPMCRCGKEIHTLTRGEKS